MSLLGPSGCGRITLLRVLAGPEGADDGTVLLGVDEVSPIPTNKHDIAMFFQSYSLFPHLHAADNTGFGLRRRGVGRAEATERTLDALALVGLADFVDRFAHELPGGQQQRVALARSLVTEPKVLLLDEPLSTLDAKGCLQLRDKIRRIQLRLGITTVFVTHDQEEALAVSDRIAVMNSGRIEQIGSPEDLYTAPSSAGVAAFVGLSSVVSGVAEGDRVIVWGQPLPLRSPADGPVDVYLRPESVRFASTEDAAIDALIEKSTFLGSMRHTLVRTELCELVRLQHAPSIHPVFGDRVLIALSPEPVVAHPRG